MKKITIENGRYEVGLGMGNWAESMEKSQVPLGTVRLIGGFLMSAYRCSRDGLFFGKWETWWTPTDEKENSSEALRAWVASL